MSLFFKMRPGNVTPKVPSSKTLNSLGILVIYLAFGQVAHCRLPNRQLINDWRSGVVLRNYGRIPTKRSIGIGAGILNGAKEHHLHAEQSGGDISTQGADPRRYPLSFRDAPPKLVEARQHGKVVLECSAYGTPAPTITWYKDGRPLFKDGARGGFRLVGGAVGEVPEIQDSLSETKSQVNLECLGQEDAGLYQCIASNGFTKKSVATEVSIVSFKDGSCKPLMDSPIPKIHQFMENYIQLIGMDALLVCRANGPHETYWVDPNGMPIDVKSQKYQMTSNGDLVVRNLSFEDMGMFQCLVKNTHGQDMKETFVYPLAVSK